jgi:DNA-binding MarR family transcriptional regulator
MNELHPQANAFTDMILEVFRLNGLLLAAGDRLTQPVGLSSARWQVLGVVEHGPISVAHVARVMGLTRQSVQQTADGLEKDGFIVYADNPHHRRSRLMRLTPQGKEALAYVAQRQGQWASQVGSTLNLADLGATLATLRQVRQILEAFEETSADETKPSQSDG